MRTANPLLLILWAASVAAVCVLSLMPGAGLPPAVPHLDKFAHFAAYAWLALLPMLGMGTRRGAFGGAGAMIFLGAALEVAQAFVPLREPSLLDLGANILGVLVGMRLGVRLKTRQALRKRGMDGHYRTDGSRRG